MLVIKHLDRFVLRTFLPLFAMTFFIVLFIVLMQFLWKYVDDLVGKGLSVDVLGELFFYAAVSMVPMALPLAILLASLMTFGNLGERFELTAMKASGISLLRVMAPLIWLVGGIAVGAFFFQNNVLPNAQVKMWTLLFSMKQKSPEVEIPEGVFYDQIPGYNLYVKHKNQNTGMLYDVMIYDLGYSGGAGTILLADSAQLAFTPDMKYLFLHLYTGEQFENLREQTNLDQNVPFRRETFLDKQVLIPFDANFNRLDDNSMRKQYVGKNITQLHQTIDSVNARVDSIGKVYTRELRTSVYSAVTGEHFTDYDENGRLKKGYAPPAVPKAAAASGPIDSLINALPENEQRMVFATALQSLRREQTEYEFKADTMADDRKTIRRHEIELLKKYTLSVACLIFFFIGAPLGAIIRKGGIGTPLVISVLLFLVYYIIDNTGYKMARDGRWIVWMGMWLSTAILAPLGIYVTYKAMNDSSVFEKDLYLNLLRKILGTKQARKINYKEVIINDADPAEAISRLGELRTECLAFASLYSRPQNYIEYWTKGYDTDKIRDISARLEEDVEFCMDLRNPMAVNKLIDLPVLRVLWAYRPSRKRWLGIALAVIFPVGIPVWLFGLKAQSSLKEEMRRIASVCTGIVGVLEEERGERKETEQ